MRAERKQSRQQISEQSHLKQNVSRLKKKQIVFSLKPRTFAASSIFVTSRLLAGNAKKIEHVIKQSRVESRRPNGSCGQSCLRDKI